MEELGVALIGAGMVAGTHISAIRDASDIALRGVWSRTAARAEGLGVPSYASLEAVAADAAVDFAIVVTPPNARASVMTPLVAAGKPILLEKPVARTGAEAAEVVALCRDAGVPLGVVFQHRARAASLAAAELVRAARSARSGWRKSPCRGGASRPITTSRGAAPMRATAAGC
jgi:predicted dehydrogenase